MANAELHATLRPVFEAVVVESPTVFSFLGRRFDAEAAAEAGDAAAFEPGRESGAAVVALAQQLYEHAYCRPLGSPPPAAAPADAGFVASLSAANAGRDRWESGWQITHVDSSGRVSAVKGGRSRIFLPGQFVTTDGPGVPPRAGSVLTAYLPRESTSAQPGFYYAYGSTGHEAEDVFGPLRLYWNVEAEKAPALLAALTERLHRFRVAFYLKLLTAPAQYDRRDSAVLFIGRRLYPLTARIAADLLAAEPGLLTPQVPLFTAALAAGLGLAEDPGNGESFGQNRCRLLSEAIWAAWRRGDQSVDGRLRELESRMDGAGLSLDRPHLCAGSSGSYPFPFDTGAGP